MKDKLIKLMDDFGFTVLEAEYDELGLSVFRCRLRGLTLTYKIQVSNKKYDLHIAHRQNYMFNNVDEVYEIASVYKIIVELCGELEKLLKSF